MFYYLIDLFYNDCKMAIKIAKYLSSGVSVLLVITTGLIVPSNTPAIFKWAKNTSPLENMLPEFKSGTIKMSALPHT